MPTLWGDPRSRKSNGVNTRPGVVRAILTRRRATSALTLRASGDAESGARPILCFREVLRKIMAGFCCNSVKNSMPFFNKIHAILSEKQREFRVASQFEIQ